MTLSNNNNLTNWHQAFCRYLTFIFIGNLVWELLHLPLYTIWHEATLVENLSAALHCTIGDLIIAVCALMAALLLFGNQNWPNNNLPLVLLVNVLLGVFYTIFSEWLNIEIRQYWAYSNLMPIIPVLGTGLSPIVQWIIIPTAGYYWATKDIVWAMKFKFSHAKQH